MILVKRHDGINVYINIDQIVSVVDRDDDGEVMIRFNGEETIHVIGVSALDIAALIYDARQDRCNMRSFAPAVLSPPRAAGTTSPGFSCPPLGSGT